ncbi:MAG: nucleotide exchange factor GrpE [Tissierellia bacterium]|nr:nucleotide exchange factor GrpE [Tissierellia bacterium]
MEKKEVLNEELAKDEKAADEEIKEEAKEEGEKVEVKEDEEQKGEENKIEELTNQLLRLQADFVNYKNRVEKEKDRIYSNATEELITELLPVLDNFERALESVEEKDGFYEGVKMIYAQILKVLNDKGLEEIDCLGKEFDPNYHHAVFAEDVEGKEEGTILEVLQKGYLLNDKVIRPSMVKVAK